jgi:hypothetical protein
MDINFMNVFSLIGLFVIMKKFWFSKANVEKKNNQNMSYKTQVSDMGTGYKSDVLGNVTGKV